MQPTQMTASRKSLYAAGVILATLALAAIYLATFWPGLLSTDSLGQFMQAESGKYNDWHPPIMAFIWSFLLFTSPPSAGYLIFQVMLLCLGLALLAGSPILADKRPVWTVFLAGITPPIWIYAGVLWKDILLAALWLCCVGALLCAKYKLESSQGKNGSYRLIIILAVFFGVLGCMTRINAVPAFAPLAFLLPSSKSIKIRLATTFLLIVGSFGATLLLEKALDVKKAYPSVSLYLFDLGGISSFTHNVKFPGNWTSEEQHLLKTKCYAPQGANNYLWGPCKFVSEKFQQDNLWGSEEVKVSWLRAIYENPLAYIKHRLNHFYTFLQNPWGHRFESTTPNTLGFEFHPGAMFGVMTQAVAIGEALNLFYPAAWLVFGVVVLLLTFSAERSQPMQVIQAALLSALLYFASYLPGGVASDFRYSYWPILAITTSTLYLAHVTIARAWSRLRSTGTKARPQDSNASTPAHTG